MTNRALLVVDMQTLSSGPRWSRCCAAKTRRLHELSIEVLTSYELAGIASIGEGYDIGLDRTPVSA